MATQSAPFSQGANSVYLVGIGVDGAVRGSTYLPSRQTYSYIALFFGQSASDRQSGDLLTLTVHWLSSSHAVVGCIGIWVIGVKGGEVGCTTNYLPA